MLNKVRTNVYVDAFNLYYGCLRGTPHRWLNLAEICRLMLPQDNIQFIKYFTALITPRPHDPDQLVRQQTYLRAITTLPNLSIVYGHFLPHEVMMPLAGTTLGQKPQYAKVIKTEEKGSDVNLATHLVYDACKNEYDVAVVITNDSDLLEPIKMVSKELGKTGRYPQPTTTPKHRASRQCDVLQAHPPLGLSAQPVPHDHER